MHGSAGARPLALTPGRRRPLAGPIVHQPNYTKETRPANVKTGKISDRQAGGGGPREGKRANGRKKNPSGVCRLPLARLSLARPDSDVTIEVSADDGFQPTE
jgi:hypothetical protein